MPEFLIPAQEIITEMVVVNSRFITTIGPIFNQDEAKGILSRVRRRFPDASHHVMAYIIDHGNSMITHSSDDGEPSGTAGRPALMVLTGSGFGNIFAVITRYFGGTKLGTGGLVKAYGEAVKSGLAILPKAQIISTSTLQLVFQYPFLERIRQLTQQNQSLILNEVFSAVVTMDVQVPDDYKDVFEQSLVNLTSGKIQVNCTGSNPQTILPVI